MRRPDLTFQKAHAAVFVCLAVSAGFLVFNSCSHHPRYNVLLITLDTTRADHLACYGFHQIQTPALDSIAKEGVLFQRAYSVAPMTLPAHTLILSSTRPSYHSVIDNGDYRVPDQLNLLPKVLKSQGFSTAAFVSAAVLKKTFNLNQGFDVYNDEDIQDQPGLNMLVAERRGDLTTDAALKWLGSNSASAGLSGCIITTRMRLTTRPSRSIPGMNPMSIPARLRSWTASPTAARFPDSA